MGPGPGALVYIKLEFWDTHYESFDTFPYPKPIEDCVVIGEFTNFKVQAKKPYWYLDIKAFKEKLWVKENFFTSDLWTSSISSSNYVVTRETYEELELKETVNDSDVEVSGTEDQDQDNGEDSDEEEEGPRAPANPQPLRRVKRGGGRPKKGQARAANSDRNPRRETVRYNDTDSSEGEQFASDDDDDGEEEVQNRLLQH